MKGTNMKPIDAIVVTLTLHGKIQQHWVYSIENGNPNKVNGSLVAAETKMEELIRKHYSPANDFSEEEWAEILGSEHYYWNYPQELVEDGVNIAFSVNTPLT
jgi:hypothetical protein